ncbi:AMP-binding protein [Sphingobium sp. HBC34]|uniref:AMP-binding protein n=1 Tax=Sphingobium cyanobacteriorum TaxID=3063954 RepID=A0ABT8ZQ78_9SPHN|nr:AMP-binding protein [Sphingobium sp. HBC34]MDO7836698.1 AMP-binding protein [Sphingobium sp. HBC34]
MAQDWDENRFDPLAGPSSIPAQLAESARCHGDRTFLVGEDGRRLTFGQTEAAARRMARAFIASGLAMGERIAVWAPNGIDWIIATLGLQLAGGVLVPLNTRFKGEEAAFILDKSRAAFLCTVGDFLGNDYVGLLRAVRGGEEAGRPISGLPDLRDIILFDTDPMDGFLSRADSVSEAELDERIATIGPDSLCDILFTSGTTGNPKGAMFSHAQALGVVRSYNFVNRIQPGDRMVIVNPFFHSFGYRAGWVSCLIGGMTAYPVAELKADALTALVEREHITVLPGPPALFQTLVDQPTGHDISSLRIGITGSANLPVSLMQACHDQLGMELVLTSYGLTENTAMGTSCRFGDSAETLANTVGRPFPGWEMRLVTSDNQPVPIGEAGEVCFRGFSVMQGYFEDPTATAEAIDADGWLHSGDVGILDERGYLRIVDRLKDIIIVGGFNVYPAEVENILRQAPGIAEVAVVGMPDHRMGEVAAAFIVPVPGIAPNPVELTTWSREHMANFKVPRRFVTLDVLPKTPLGKVRRVELKQIAQTLNDTSPQAN